MTVADLIARLGAFDPNLDVVMPSEAEDFADIAEVILDLAWPSQDGEVLLAFPDEPDARPVVRLMEPGTSNRPPAVWALPQSKA